VDDCTIRGLREVELWLAEVDWRHLCSLPETPEYFIKNISSTRTGHTSNNTCMTALKLPTSLHSSDGGIFISPGWEDLPGSLPALREEDERSFLQKFLTELNAKFAHQLDAYPSMDRTSQLAPDSPDGNCLGIVLAGSSHSVRLIDQLESANLRVVDSTVPGFRITEKSVMEMAADLAEKIQDLDPSNTVVSIQLLDNSCFECKTPEGAESFCVIKRMGVTMMWVSW
jgi:hypothetical protein